MVNTYTAFIAGEFENSTSPTRFEVVNPANEQLIATVPAGTVEQAERAVEAARVAFDDWSRLPRTERLALMGKLGAGLAIRADEMAELIRMEIGTPASEARSLQVGLSQGAIQSAIDALTDFDPDAYEVVQNSHVYREPVGVVAAISPWNYPLFLSMTKIAPALAAGCTVVHKPSEIKPLSTLLFAEIVRDAGFPAGVYNVVVGDGPSVGQSIAGHPSVDMVAFTGSTAAGKRVYEVASRTVKNINLELGGKSASLILPSADLAGAVEASVRQVFFASGQACFAWSRVLVPADRLEEAEAVAAKVAESYVLGDPADYGTTLGPVVSKVQQDRVRNYIDTAVAEGGRVVAGGSAQPENAPNGYYVAGTVLSGITPDMTVAKEEIFGPVVCLMPYETVEEAIAIANGTEFGLHGGVFAGDKDEATAVARRLRTGRVDINGAQNNIEAPFGGYRQSGVGREFGRLGFEEFLEVKAIQY